jgi:ABC-type dipeptide/oligopeptide/nickel transport system permease component
VDDPLPMQYVAWLGGVLRGDLGWSGVSVAPVSEVLPARFVATMELALYGMLLAVLFGVSLGTFAGARRNRVADHLTRVLTVSGASLPLFWFALLMLILFYVVWPIAPVGRFDEDTYSQIVHFTGFYSLDAVLNLNGAALLDAFHHLALPALVLAFEGMAVIARMMRSSLVEELGEDYVDSARAKGLSERHVIRRHARRNALVPTVTVIGLSLGVLLQGSVVVEIVFRWPGLGQWATDAVLRGDRATIMAFVLVTSLVFLFINLVVDVVYAYLDRRVVLGT